jgi:hypothetical protein
VPIMEAMSDYWARQKQLPLRKRERFWWTSVALPTILMAFWGVVFAAAVVAAIVLWAT